MKQQITEVSITKISKEEAFELRNEILKISDGNIQLQTDKYPKLNILFALLSGSFEHSKEGVHFIKERGIQ